MDADNDKNISPTPEQPTLELHRRFRDRIAPLETDLAEFIRARGHEVVGKHGSEGKPDPKLVGVVQRAFGAAVVA